MYLKSILVIPVTVEDYNSSDENISESFNKENNLFNIKKIL